MQRAVDCADWSRWRGFKVSYRAVIPATVIPAAVIPGMAIPVMAIPVMAIPVMVIAGTVIAGTVIVDAGNPFTGELRSNG